MIFIEHLKNIAALFFEIPYREHSYKTREVNLVDSGTPALKVGRGIGSLPAGRQGLL
jgi:hypothetical protein